MTDAMAETSPRVCQMTLARRCGVRQAMVLHFRSASGFEWYEGMCQSHAEPRSDQVRAGGGELLSVEVLPVPPAPSLVMAEPVTAAVEPEPVSAPPRRDRARRRSA